MLRKLRQKGSFYVEYALILSFVVVTGAALSYGENSFAYHAKSIIVDASKLLAEAAGFTFEEEESAPVVAAKDVTLQNVSFAAKNVLVTEDVEPPYNKDNPEGSLDVYVNSESGAEDGYGASNMVALEAGSTYKAVLNLSDEDKAALAGTQVTFSNFYQVADNKYDYNLANAQDSNSYASSYSFDSSSGSYANLSSYTITTSANTNPYTYVSVQAADGASDVDLEKASAVIKNKLVLQKQ